MVVGSALARSSGSAPIHLDPVRWPGGGTGISDLGNLSGPQEAGEAFGASPTGSIIVGTHFSNSGKDAWRWQGSGLVALPHLIGGSVIAADAYAVSDNGATIVGYSNAGTLTLPGGTVVASDLQAVRWTGASFGTIQSLGPFPGALNTDSAALAVSADGSIIVGRADGPDLSDRAFIWDRRRRHARPEDGAGRGVRARSHRLGALRGDRASRTSSPATSRSWAAGINPQGQPEGFVAFLSTPACSDGSDNDGDTLIDHPADPGCTSPVDWSETLRLQRRARQRRRRPDRLPRRRRLRVGERSDRAARLLGRRRQRRRRVRGPPAGSGLREPAAPIENPACQNGLDDDFDRDTDHPDDAQCTAPFDRSETPDCSDGLDNDGDGQIDFPADAQCESDADLSEAAQCADGVDNDGDGRTDYPEQYPGCIDADDPIEAAQCGDGVDNDGDSAIDYPADTAARAPAGQSESPVALAAGDLIAVDRASRAVFRVDTTTGAQTLVSQAAHLQAPQGVAQRGGELVVADPAGLVVVSGSGAQRLASPPLVGNESLQVVFDAALDAYVLEASGISKVIWNPTGIGAKSTWLAVPTPEPIPLLSLLNGDALAIEQSGSFVTSGSRSSATACTA